jgi:L-ascorbate metabolism protein UlaG (beta-lactamase superfamily)
MFLVSSHSHFDHIGDVSKLPNSTQVFVGPGTLADALPGYPADNSSWNLESDFVYVSELSIALEYRLTASK